VDVHSTPDRVGVGARRPLRIGVDGRFLQDKFHGVGRYAHGLLSGLRAAEGDHLVRVFVDESLPNHRFPLEELVEPERLELCSVSTPLYSVRELGVWPARLWRTPVDVFHSPFFWSPMILPCPLVTTVHDMIFDRYPEYIPGLRYMAPYRVSSRIALRRARSVIAVSAATKQDIVTYAGTSSEKIVTIPNGVEARYQPVLCESERRRVRDRYRLPERYVLAVGARRPHKNVGRLVSAFARLVDQLPHSLVLVGPVDRRFVDDAEDGVARLRARQRVLEIEHVEEADLPAVYSMAELFVQPSVIEGFGLPVLEAMASGCPVACSKSSSLPEVAGEAALLFDPLSEAEMSATIQDALTSEPLRSSLQQRGLLRARCFTWDSVATRTLAVYAHAAGIGERASA
jgi:glycosyltransferase involved in cell wall biosynthesis